MIVTDPVHWKMCFSSDRMIWHFRWNHYSIQLDRPESEGQKVLDSKKSSVFFFDIELFLSSPFICGTFPGGRSKLGHSASEVGPGEYTAEHGLVPGPTAKMLGRLGEGWNLRNPYGLDSVKIGFIGLVVLGVPTWIKIDVRDFFCVAWG